MHNRCTKSSSKIFLFYIIIFYNVDQQLLDISTYDIIPRFWDYGAFCDRTNKSCGKNRGQWIISGQMIKITRFAWWRFPRTSSRDDLGNEVVDFHSSWLVKQTQTERYGYTNVSFNVSPCLRSEWFGGGGEKGEDALTRMCLSLSCPSVYVSTCVYVGEREGIKMRRLKKLNFTEIR